MPAKIASVPLEIAVKPHNGTPEYQITCPVYGDEMGGQIQMIRLAMRHKVLAIAVGRRVGKTTMRPFLWMEEAAQTPGIYRAAFVAQDHTKAYEMFEFCKKMWGPIITESVGDPKTQHRFVRTKALAHTDAEAVNEGMEIWFFSGAHPHYEKIRGKMVHFNRIDLDECSLLHEKILNVVNPMLLEASGSLTLTGTPDCDGIGAAWFEQYFNNGNNPEMTTWASMNAPSMSNPLVSPEGIAQLKEMCLTDEDWEQEGLARFLSGRGSVFSRLDEVFTIAANHSAPAWHTAMHAEIYSTKESLDGSGVSVWHHKDPITGHRYLIGVDWARVRDATCISVFDATTMEQVLLMRLQGEDYEEGVEWVSRLRGKYNNAIIHSDANGVGDSMTRTLQRRYRDGCIAHKYGGTNKAGYVRDGQMLFNHLEVKMIDCVWQRNEFKVFRKEKSEATGRVKYTHPPNGTDDSIDAFLMCAESLRMGAKKAAPPRDEGPAWLSMDWFQKQRKRKAKRKRIRASRI